MANYTKEQAHRLAKVEVDERNRLAREDLDLSDQETRHNQPRLWEKIEWMRTWQVVRCGECKAPLVVKIGDILDPTFIPDCDHGLPFGQGIPGMNDDNADSIYRGMLRRQIAGLAQIEAQLRTGMMEDYDPIDPLWAIYPCASCGTSTASTPQKALIGGARCRLCFGKPIKHAARIDAIIREISVFHPEFNVETKRCLCQHVPDVAMHGSIEIYGEGEGGNKEVLLSWCSARPIEERERWVRTYAARVGLDMPELGWLLDDVGDPASSHQDRPLLVRPASAS